MCQRTKPRRTVPAAPLQPNEVPSLPWEIVSVDLIGPLPESKGFDAIMVVVDRFSKKIEAIPTNVELSSLGAAKHFRDYVFKHHGLPRKVISDRGPQFVSNFMKDLMKLLGIEGNPSTAFHPQTDGQTERINQEIEQYLRIFINQRQDDWADWLPLAQFSYNDKIHQSTGYSPFYLNYGQHPYKGGEPRGPIRNQAAEDFVTEIKDIRKEAEAALKQAAETMKHYYDRKRKPSRPYRVGDMVYLEATNINTQRPAKKLDDRRYGPFKITKKVGASAYELAIPKTWKAIHPVFNESLLTPYHEPHFPSQKKPPPPPPELVDGEVEYEVESIDDSRLYKGKLQYLVNWKGYPKEERTWEDASNLKNSPELVEKFHRENPSAPRRITKKLRFIPYENFTEPSGRIFDWTAGKFKASYSPNRRPKGTAEPMPENLPKCRKGWCPRCNDVHEDVNLKGGVMS